MNKTKKFCIDMIPYALAGALAYAFDVDHTAAMLFGVLMFGCEKRGEYNGRKSTD